VSNSVILKSHDSLFPKRSYAMSLLANVNARTNTAPGSTEGSGFTTQGTLAFSPPAHRKVKGGQTDITTNVTEPGFTTQDFGMPAMNSTKDLQQVKFGTTGSYSETDSVSYPISLRERMMDLAVLETQRSF
jgi:hypothetical protein